MSLAPTAPPDSGLRDVVETLARFERQAGSSEERAAARWIAARLDAAGAHTRIEEERYLDGYSGLLLPLVLAGALCGASALLGRRRRLAAAVAALAAAAIADDVSNGARPWRRAFGPRHTTTNVVAEAGDLEARRTLIVMAHHDAAPTGRVFDQSAQRAFAERFPKAIERMDTSLPLWWPVIGGPALVAAGAAGRRRGVILAGTALSLLCCATGLDIVRSPTVPGANDNLSAVAALVELAERLRRAPTPGLRVLLVSCGAEEVLQGGIYGFAARHFPTLAPERTWVLNLDTVGSPELIMVEGEGPLWMQDYCEPAFRDLVADAAERAGVPLRRGLRARASSDSVIPSRAGYPTAMLSSWDRHRCLSNYHQMSDVPENLDYGTVAHAVAVSEAVARALAAAAGG